jgi:hypothetical protein
MVCKTSSILQVVSLQGMVKVCIAIYRQLKRPSNWDNGIYRMRVTDNVCILRSTCGIKQCTHIADVAQGFKFFLLFF